MAKHTYISGSGHPISAAVACARTAISAVDGDAPWALTTAETRDLMGQLTQLATQVAELDLRVLAHAGEAEAGEEGGATNAATWLAHQTKQTVPSAYAKTHLAAGLLAHPMTREAMGTGHVLVDQARVIVEAVDALPDDVPAGVADQAEKFLLAEAEHHDAKGLKKLGRKVLDVVAPEIGEAHEAKLLDDEEAAAVAATKFSMSEDGHGQVHGKFTIPSAYGAMLHKALLAFAAPKHQAATNGAGTYVPGRPSGEKLGEAFCDYIARYPRKRLPMAGGVNATVVVTMTLETLLGGLKAASLDTGEQISPGLARRWACEARIIPMVLGGDSKVLDVGRTKRFHDETQRLALIVEQKVCQHTTCQVPASMCEVHHTTPWSRGGRTNTVDAELLCPRHHHLTHAALDKHNHPART